MEISGFKEEYGLIARKREYVERVLSDIMRENNYDKITIPVVEPFSSYSEDVVGKSPWPEWNEKCIFRFRIVDYQNDYSETNCSSNEVCLIPEGTVSITRWLASIINKGGSAQRKLFYCFNCYRNELISTLSQTKCREFQQFGVEIMDSTGIESDLELFKVVVSLLSSLGIDERNIRVRVNDVAIFNKLVSLCNISQEDTISLKKQLDSIAECHAGKHPDDFSNIKSDVIQLLSKYSLPEQYKKLWEAILDRSYSNIEEAIKIFPASFQSCFNTIKEILHHFENEKSKIELDLSVIRSHQYYSGLSFEIDVVTENDTYFEIAGGGRYDRLVGTFLKANKANCNMTIPCTGFAFGMDRVITMLNKLGLLSGTKEIYSKFNF